MAERIVSPGVFTRENDLSFLSQGIGEIGAAFIGPFKQGPAFVPTIVRTQSEFEEIFGTPDGTYYTEYAVQNYLREAGVATIVRVGGIGGYEQTAPLAIVASGSSGDLSGGKIIAVLFNTVASQQDTGFTSVTLVDAPEDDNATSSSAFQVSGTPFASSIDADLDQRAINDVSDVFGNSPFDNTANGGTQAYSYLFFENFASKNLTAVSSSFTLTREILASQDFSGTEEINAIQPASTPWVISQRLSANDPSSVSELFRFHTLGDGTLYNTKYKVGISNVKAAGEDGSTDYSVFSVTIRAFNDSDRRKVVLETFNNVNLDPSSPNYIARVIGDRNLTIDNSGKITETGDYENKSKYVRVEVKQEGTYPISAAPFGHSAYFSPIHVGSTGLTLPALSFSLSASLNTPSSAIHFSGINLQSTVGTDNIQFLKPIPKGAIDNGTTVGTSFSFDNEQLFTEQERLASSLVSGSQSAAMVKRQFILGFQGGFDGMNPVIKPALGTDITTANTQGFNCTNATSDGTIAYTKAIAAISNPDEFDINMVVTPGINYQDHPSVVQRTIDMVESRQDAFYIADFSKASATIQDAVDAASAVDSNYVATYYPWVKTIDSNTNKLTTVPPSTLLPAVYASNDRLAAEWFAPAGLNRGGITGAVNVLNRLTHSERDTLYENKVNPIAVFPGQGIVAYGQKTLQDRASALDRINVRRLLITVKKFVASTSRFLVFEQNTSTTRARFLNTVNPYFEAIQQRQGLYAFNVVMDETNNTPDVIDRNILAGQIFLQPAKTAEFIVIDFNILPTGATFSA
jgi:hypothetical protein